MKHILTSIGLGLLGVLVAVGVTMAASNLSSQSIGISAEPTTAGEQLAVPASTTTTARPRPTRVPREASKFLPPTTQTRPTVDDDARADEREDHEREDRGGSDDSKREDRSGDSDNSGSGSSGSGKDDDD